MLSHKKIKRLGNLLGTLAFSLDIRHRRIVRRNLKFAYPQWSWDLIQKHSKRIFQNMGITILEIFQMAPFEKEDILRNIRIKGRSHLLKALKSPKGAILISAHIGNWEMSHLAISCYIQKPLLVVAREIRSKKLNDWVNRLRIRFDNRTVDKKGALPKMVRALQKGQWIGVLIDQNTKSSEGVDISFFNRKAIATPVAALLARRYNAPVLPVFCIREADGRLTLLVEPPIALQTTNDLEADLLENTQLMANAVEKVVRSYPDQWFWFHKRWKRYYPNLYPEDMDRWYRRREKKRQARSKPV
ncbi:MAG: hypothetical protein JW786_09210 [Desulfobacterales bacterium]|nr:hypothetical protein [Desulfobacterales bacterium]